MNSSEPKRKLIGPWQSLHVVIWVIGLYILFTRGSFFPGILVLIAVSALYEAFLRRYVPGSYTDENDSIQASPQQPPTTTPIEPAEDAPLPSPLGEHPLELLPPVCPNCGGPIHPYEVKWTGPQSANCPYCGTHLPLNKS